MPVTTRGPLFDGRADAAVRAYLEDAGQEVADRGVNLVHAELDHVLRHPTGYYKAHITTDRQRNDFVVNDSGVVYGPWLEGVGERNKTTRFKGYATFRRITQRLRSEARPIAERVLSKYIGRMN